MEQKSKHFYDFGPFTLNVAERVLLHAGQEVPISPKACDVLHYLVANPQTVISREQLRKAVWGTDNVVDNVVDQQICEIRKTLTPEGGIDSYIQTKRGKGWRFIAPVASRSDKHVPYQPDPAAHSMVSAPDNSYPASDVPAAPPKASRGRIPKWTYAWGLVVAGAAIFTGSKALSSLTSEPRVTAYHQLTNDGRVKNGLLATDGRLVYFSEPISPDSDPLCLYAAVSISGGDIVFPKWAIDPAVVLDFARKADKLLLAQPTSPWDKPMWLSALTSLTMEPTGIRGDAYNSGISPDGSSLAYARESSLVIAELTAGRRITTVQTPGQVKSPKWSPDGGRIRFSVYDGATDTVWLSQVQRDGSKLRRLPFGTGHECDGTWTPDGRYFVYQDDHDKDGQNRNLWIVGDRGVWSQKPIRLTDGLLDFHSPLPAADGSKLFAIGTKSRGELVRFDLVKREFVPFWEGLPAVDISFSRNGQRAAYGRYPEHTLWVSDAGGTNRRQLTFPPLEAFQPHWSPDGKRIAFMGAMPGKPNRVYIVAATGGPPQEAKPDDAFDQGVPSWSENGCCLIFGELLYRKANDAMSIHLLDLSTSTERALPGSQGKWTPRWSPDGRYIAAQTPEFGPLVLFDTRSQSWTPLVDLPNINDPVWSSDSKFVYFRARSPATLFRIRIVGKEIEELSLVPGLEYPWSGVAPDGAPLVLRSVRSEEIYSLDWKLP